MKRDPLDDPSWYELDPTPESSKVPFWLGAGVIVLGMSGIAALAFYPW